MKKFEAVISIEKKVIVYADNIKEAEEKALAGRYWYDDPPKLWKRNLLMIYPYDANIDEAIEEGTKAWNGVNPIDLRE